MLGVSTTTIQMMVERGELRAWKTRGGHRRISVESIGQLKKQRAERGDPTADRCRLKVVVVEDDTALRRLYENYFAESGLPIELSTAADGFEALLLIERLRPDVLITDLLMAPMDGFALLRTLRARREFDVMVIIAVTGADEAVVIARGGVPRGTIVYPKPVPMEKLRGFLEASLLRKQLECA